MAGEVALFEWPGVYTVEEGSYTHALGTAPGVFSITCRPQPSPPDYHGNMTIRQGDTVLVFPDCIVDQGSVTIDGSGQIVGLLFYDRRWKWRFPTISGQYNVRKENGDLDHLTEKTPQELAQLLLDSMGEVPLSIGALPNDARPYVNWENATSATELDSLCELLGCRVALRENNQVVIVRLGIGERLPITPDIMSGGAVLDPPEAPDEFQFVGEPDRFQVDLELEAVGYETDKEVRVVDQLSYKPALGWDGADLEGDIDEITDHKKRNLAKASVFKSYRVKIPPEGLKIPGYQERIFYRWQLEFLNKLIVTKTEDGETQPQEPFVYGVWYDGRDKEGNVVDGLLPATNALLTNYDKATVYPHGFTFDDKDHVLNFGGLMVREDLEADGRPLRAAQLRFRTCVNIRERKTRAYVQTQVLKTTGYTNGTKPALIKQSEYVRTLYPEYAGSFEAYRLVDNKDEFLKDAAYYIDLAIRELQVIEPQRIVYESIRAIHLDGAIQQVTWEVSNSATPRTTACRNNDITEFMPNYRERRRIQRQTEVQKAFKEINQIIKKNGRGPYVPTGKMIYK